MWLRSYLGWWLTSYSQCTYDPPQSEIEIMAVSCGDVSAGVWIMEPAMNRKLPVLVAWFVDRGMDVSQLAPLLSRYPKEQR